MRALGGWVCFVSLQNSFSSKWLLNDAIAIESVGGQPPTLRPFGLASTKKRLRCSPKTHSAYVYRILPPLCIFPPLACSIQYPYQLDVLRGVLGMCYNVDWSPCSKGQGRAKGALNLGCGGRGRVRARTWPSFFCACWHHCTPMSPLLSIRIVGFIHGMWPQAVYGVDSFFRF